MPQTEEQVRTAQLDRREQQLKALEAQLQRDGEHLYQEAAAKCAKQLAEIDQREAALAPKEAALTEREADVSAREGAVRVQAEQCAATDAVQRRTATQQAALEQELNRRLAEVKAREDQHRRLQAADLAVLDQKRQVLREEFESRELRLQASKEALDAQRAEQAKRESTIARDRERADQLLQQAQTTEAASVKEAKERAATQEARERAMEARADALAKREAALSEAIRVTTQKLADVEAESARLAQFAKGLSKAKLDIETKEAQVERRERLVNAIVKRKEVAEELAKLE
jgi:hypothetical protein